jgi:hypothetical protein
MCTEEMRTKIRVKMEMEEDTMRVSGRKGEDV